MRKRLDKLLAPRLVEEGIALIQRYEVIAIRGVQIDAEPWLDLEERFQRLPAIDKRALHDLLQFVVPRAICESTIRQGFAPMG